MDSQIEIKNKPIINKKKVNSLIIKLKYEDLDYIVEKQIGVDMSLDMLDLTQRKYFAYILYNREHKIRFSYISTRYLLLGSTIKGKSISFISMDLKNRVNLKDYFDMFGKPMVTYSDKKTEFSFIPMDVFMQKVKTGETTFYKNKYKIHDKKICFDKNLWFIGELKAGKCESFKKKFWKLVLNNAQIDDRVKRVVISQLFILEGNELQDMNTHSILLTQGSTGKSSVIGILGKRLDTTSNSGIYGYYSTGKDVWNSGVVSQTKDSIILDEVNELISKNVHSSRSDNIFSNINTPLEEGSFSYGKAGGRSIEFGNQFIFMGNISFNFHFENFLIGVMTNNETAGRRFAYLLYDDNVKFINGGRRIKKQTEYIHLLKEYVSFIFEYCIHKRNFLKFFNNSSVLDLEQKYKKKLKQLIKGKIVHENTLKFLDYFVEKSISTRLKAFALKLAIFEYIDELLNCPSLDKFLFSKINNRFLIEYELLLKDIELSITNIIEHQDKGLINDKHIEITGSVFENFSKNIKNISTLVYKNLDCFEPKSKILYYDNIKIKGNLRYLISDLKKNKTSLLKLNKELNCLGITIIELGSNQYGFRILNQVMFEKYITLYENHYDKHFNENPVSKPEPKKEIKKEVIKPEIEVIKPIISNDNVKESTISPNNKDNIEKIDLSTKTIEIDTQNDDEYSIDSFYKKPELVNPKIKDLELDDDLN